MTYHYWIPVQPDNKRPIGGVKQIHRLAEAIDASGRKATIIQIDEDFHPGWFSSTVSTISAEKWRSLFYRLNPEKNIIILPETYAKIFHTIAPNLPLIIFNQNSSYTYGTKPNTYVDPTDIQNVYKSKRVKQILCVSKYDELFFIKTLRIPSNKVSRVINSININPLPSRQLKTKKIAFMPRKNARHAEIALSIILNNPLFSKFDIAVIDQCTHKEAMNKLSESLIFLSFGHPEGFGLPIAEAIAQRCAVIGYSGIGGRELFGICKKFGLDYQIEYGDFSGFLDSSTKFMNFINKKPKDAIEALSRAASEIRTTYSLSNMNKSIEEALIKAEKFV